MPHGTADASRHRRTRASGAVVSAAAGLRNSRCGCAGAAERNRARQRGASAAGGDGHRKLPVKSGRKGVAGHGFVKNDYRFLNLERRSVGPGPQITRIRTFLVNDTPTT